MTTYTLTIQTPYTIYKVDVPDQDFQNTIEHILKKNEVSFHVNNGFLYIPAELKQQCSFIINRERSSD